jgi:hypothetical protein
LVLPKRIFGYAITATRGCREIGRANGRNRGPKGCEGICVRKLRKLSKLEAYDVKVDKQASLGERHYGEGGIP